MPTVFVVLVATWMFAYSFLSVLEIRLERPSMLVSERNSFSSSSGVFSLASIAVLDISLCFALFITRLINDFGCLLIIVFMAFSVQFVENMNTRFAKFSAMFIF